MKVGLFSPYLDTLGGGERYFLTAAQYFLNQGHHVDIFWNGDRDCQVLQKRFDLDLSKARFISDIFFSRTTLPEKIWRTSQYDLIFFLSDGSIPVTFAKKNILHFQVPFNYSNQKTLLNRLKLTRFSDVVCNSRYTKGYIDKTYGLNSSILYPPVDIEKFSPGPKSEIILSVGRFFAPSNPKKQEIMIEVFKEMNLKKWKLVLIGGVASESANEISLLKQKAKGSNIEIITDSDFKTLQKYYSEAKIYWHAAGFGEDLEKFPDRAEHFGMTTVEAMAAGAVPVVFGGGGQLEIVEDGISGYFWKQKDDLKAQTLALINNSDLRQRLAIAAQQRAKLFSKEKFFDQLEELCGS
ncbi:glycosyltransferase family 4 protein [Patescibacteria group bacterium]|nr:glycosyltransferase family 4 protein [Patescibacteria group bacterium]